MKVRATKATAFLAGIWVSIVMEGFQWWQKPSANTAANSSNQIGFATTFVLFLLIAVPCFVFVFGTFEARPTFLLSKEGMKSAGTKFLRLLCVLGGFGVAALAWALAIRLLGTHP